MKNKITSDYEDAVARRIAVYQSLMDQLKAHAPLLTAKRPMHTLIAHHGTG
jgi:hypothetical protein